MPATSVRQSSRPSATSRVPERFRLVTELRTVRTPLEVLQADSETDLKLAFCLNVEAKKGYMSCELQRPRNSSASSLHMPMSIIPSRHRHCDRGSWPRSPARRGRGCGCPRAGHRTRRDWRRCSSSSPLRATGTPCGYSPRAAIAPISGGERPRVWRRKRYFARAGVTGRYPALGGD